MSIESRSNHGARPAYQEGAPFVPQGARLWRSWRRCGWQYWARQHARLRDRPGRRPDPDFRAQTSSTSRLRSTESQPLARVLLNLIAAATLALSPGGRQVTFTSPINQAYANELAAEETLHVEFLRSAIAATGAVPISMPNIDFSQSFATAAQAAGLGSGFDAFANDTNFLLASYIFEDVGVTAYHGALTSISNPLYLDKASGIMATEAYHAGIVRTALFAAGQANATNAISFLRQQLTGVAGTPAQGNDHGVGTTASPSIFDGDGNAIAWDRSVRQVLNVVYGAQNASSGLFFPNGVNAAF